MVDYLQRVLFKHNFLKQTTIRIDYIGLLDKDIENIVYSIKLNHENYKFSELEENIIDYNEFMVNDPKENNSKTEELSNNIKMYSFRNSMGMELRITKYFSILLNHTNYIDFTKLSDLFYQIFNNFKFDNYFKILRIGVKKINACILKNINSVVCYFNEKYFGNNIKNIFNEEDIYKYLLGNNSDSFYINNKFCNLSKIISKGILENNLGNKTEGYQIIIDIDCYIKDEQILKSLKDAEFFNRSINEINEILFKIYINLLTENFIEMLKQDDFKNNDIIGVNKNEQF